MIRKYRKINNEIDALIRSGNLNKDELLNIFKAYEHTNIKLIEKLSKRRKLEKRRISGALKQTINAHGHITPELIGSATKRVHGALLNNVDDPTKPNVNSFIWGLIIGVLIMLLII